MANVRKGVYAIAALCLAFGACKTAERLTRQTLRVVPGGRNILPEFDRYARMAHVLRRYHDSGVLDERAVLDVLRDAGVFGRPKKSPPGTAPSAKPFPVPSYPGAYRWPLRAGVVSSEFGGRWGKQHRGMDIAADRRSPVYAAAPGKVLYAGDQLSGYGNVVILRHDSKSTTLYAHNDALRVRTEDWVAADQVIALLGSTGRSTGPHVHFEFREADRPVNPRKKLPKSGF